MDVSIWWVPAGIIASAIGTAFICNNNPKLLSKAVSQAQSNEAKAVSDLAAIKAKAKTLGVTL